MLHTHKRITSGLAALTLALATATPAAARPFDLNGGQGTVAPAGLSTSPPVQTASHHSNGTDSDWGYLAAGTGVVSLALIGLGGTTVARRQRRTRRSAIAA